MPRDGYATRTIWRRVPIGYAFGEFARTRGARVVSDLPDHVDAFVADRVSRHVDQTGSDRSMAKEVRGPVEQMLSVVQPDFEGAGRRHRSLPSLPAPYSDEDSFDAIDEAIAQLGRARGVNIAGEDLIRVVASLIEHAQSCLPLLVGQARASGASWTGVSHLLGTNPADAWERYDPDSATADTRIPFDI